MLNAKTILRTIIWESDFEELATDCWLTHQAYLSLKVLSATVNIKNNNEVKQSRNNRPIDSNRISAYVSPNAIFSKVIRGIFSSKIAGNFWMDRSLVVESSKACNVNFFILLVSFTSTKISFDHTSNTRQSAGTNDNRTLNSMPM